MNEWPGDDKTMGNKVSRASYLYVCQVCPTHTVSKHLPHTIRPNNGLPRPLLASVQLSFHLPASKGMCVRDFDSGGSFADAWDL